MSELAATIRAALEIDGAIAEADRTGGPALAAAPATSAASAAHQALAPAVAQLLALGGDERIAVDPRTGRNRYGTSLTPQPNELWFSSSTASSITRLGQEAVIAAATTLMTGTGDGNSAGFALADTIRQQLATTFATPETATVLVGSGTEAEILALVIALATMGGPITNIVVAPDETGRGVLTAAAGRHFLPTSSLGGAVETNRIVAGLDHHDITTDVVHVRDAAGRPFPEDEIDSAAAAAVERALIAGRNVLLHVLDCSKTGLSGVSRETALALSRTAPGRILVLVDACQLRAPEARLRRDIHNGFMVAVTGSKFAAGPAFSGALLLPPPLAGKLSLATMAPPQGLTTLSARADWPEPLRAWCADHLQADCNIGLLLRWVAALAEIERYRAVEAGLRDAIAEAFARAVRQRAVAVLGPGALDPADAATEPSIICITVANGHDAPDIAARLHDALRTAGPSSLPDAHSAAMARACHVGQPVKLGQRTVLRVCASAPMVAEVAGRVREAASLEEAMQPLERDLDLLFAKWAQVSRTLPRAEPHATPGQNAKTELDPEDWQAFRDTSHRALDAMIDHLATIRDRPVWQPMPDRLRAEFRQPLPKDARPLETALEDFDRAIKPYVTGNTHPMFMGWVHGGGTPVGMLAEMLAAGLNANCGGRDHAGIEVERQVTLWAAQMLGFPASASGVMVTGTSMANFLAVLIARDQALGHDVRRTGLTAAETHLVAYTSAEAHGCIAQAMQLAGIGSDQLRLISVDSSGRIDTDELQTVMAADRTAGLTPFLLVGTAGSVNTGAVDPLSRLADIASRERVWFHVDGAFGALAALAPGLRPILDGIEAAQSVAFDFHKWGQVPYDAGFLLVRDAAAHCATFASPATYLSRLPRGLAAGDTWPCDLGPDLSRSFRALKTWLTLTVHGADRIGASIERCCRVARHLGRLVEATPELELRAPIALNIVCIGLTDATHDALVPQIVMDLHERGVAVPSLTTIKGRPVIRAAIVNHRTREDDADRLMAEIATSLQRVTGARKWA